MRTLQKSWTWKRILSASVILALLMALYVYLGASLWRASPTDRLGFVVCAMILVIFGLLGRQFPAIDRAIQPIVAASFGFSFIAGVSAAIIAVFRWLPAIIFRMPLWLQIIVLSVWGLILAVALALIATKARRKRMFEMLRKVGSVALVVCSFIFYSFMVLAIAVMFFSTGTYILASHGSLSLIVSPERKHLLADPMFLYGALQDFFLWHFLEAVPLLKVNQTLRWNEPLTYASPAVGGILLMFKITVIVPVTAAFLAYWKEDWGALAKE